MKNKLKSLLLFVIIVPSSVFACSLDGATAIYVNGIFTDEAKAKEDTRILNKEFYRNTNREDVKIINGYNPSHFAGLGDAVQVASQALGSSINTFDRDTILMQIHPEVQTQKILLVGHSQGTFYTNELYDYLVQNGVPKKSIAVYNLATPASFVSGGGPYLTSANDNLIRKVRELAAATDVSQPLDSNIIIPISKPETSELWRGHAFSGEYLAGAPAKIISTIDEALNELEASDNVLAEGGCFTPPPKNLAYKAQELVFAVGDSAVFAVVDGGKAVKDGTLAITNTLSSGLAGVFEAVRYAFASVFYGSSVTQADLEENLEISFPSEQLEAVAVEQSSQVEPGSESAPSASVEEIEVESETNNNSSEPSEDFSDASFSNNPQQNPARDPFGLIAIPLSSMGAGGGINDTGVNATSSSETLATPQDTTGPDLTFSISECGNSLSSAGCLSTSTTATLVWASAASDLASYELSCTAGGSACAGFPKNFSATSSVSQTESLNDFTAYSFTLKAVDSSGNETSISRSIETASRPVVINEAAWMGNTGTSSALTNDEWIELKNNTAQAINFSNKWVLRTSDSAPYISLSDSIPANGYYLLERTDDLTVNDIAANQIYGNDGASWALNNTGENVFLEYVSAGATSTMDEIVSCANWCLKGDNNSSSLPKRTMERVDSLSAGTDWDNWATALGEFILNGHDAHGAAIGGTPKAKNSASYLVSTTGSIASAKTLKKSNSPYLISRSGLAVSNSGVLTIEPGVVIKFVSASEPSLTVNGTIQANGAADDPVIFTAFADDNYGGDMNADGVCNPADASSTASCPSTGTFKYILVNSSSQSSSFSNTVIRYGGRYFTTSPSNLRAAVSVDNTSVTFASTTIEHSQKHGLYLNESASQISGSTFRNNGDSGTNNDAAGIFVASSSPTITSSIFTGNRYGLYLEGSPQASASSNVFNGNAVEAVRVNFNNKAAPSLSSNTGSNNTVNGIVLAGAIGGLATSTLNANDISYVLKTVDIAASSTLTFETGVVVKGYPFDGSFSGKLTVKNGAKLFLDGASASDFVFTSLYDDTVGGNTDNSANSPSAGSWFGIVVENGGRIRLKGFTLRYAGLGLFGSGDNRAGINIDQGSGSVELALIEKNFQNGIRLNSVSSFSVKNSTIRNHTEEWLAQAAGIQAIGSTVNLEDITFSGNDLDIRASGAYSVSCANCGSPVTSPSPL